MSRSGPESDAARLLRFDLATQRNHLIVYSLALVTGLVGRAFGVFPLRMSSAFLLWGAGCATALLLHVLYARGIDRRYLNPIWLTTDVLYITAGVATSGGSTSPWFIWYIAASCGAAFAVGKRAAYIVSAAYAATYIGLLMLIGQATFWNGVMLLAICRMLFLIGASVLFLTGIANLQEKRLRIRHLEAEEKRKVEELTRLTAELADANRRTQEADRLKSQFLANMSHELRTPMNSIIGFSEILIERLAERIEPKHLGFLQHIHTSGQHLLGIINDVLDLSKVEAGKMEIYPEFFSVEPVIESVCSVMRGMSKANPHFVVEVARNVPQIETDLAKFKQVLFNLLSNAVKFAPAAKPITIRVVYEGTGDDSPDGRITVSVRDEGIGIDPAHHSVIFEEFRQVDGTVRREFGGTGLGLALVKKFVELQGGIVAVDSRLGAGSTFSFTLPVRSRAAVVTRPTIVPAHTGERVLVVEDDANAYELISSALGSAGYLSIRARHGDEALRLARESQPAAITLDLVLPGVDGWEVLKRLKGDASTRQLPVVIISMVDNRDLGIALGADDYFVKPVDRDRLIERLREVTSRHGSVAGIRLLVIDDDPNVHLLLDEELTPMGYRVRSALSGEEGLRAADEERPDAIVLDLMMPGMSGFEVASTLQDNVRTANIPILVLTSKELSLDDRLALQTNVMSFVQKGKSAREQLLREIRRVTSTPVTAH